MTGPWGLVAGALRLDPAAFEAIVARPDGLRIALVVLVAGGLSNAVGQSVALFAGRVRPWRFVASLAVGAVLFAISVLVWGGAVAGLTTLAFDAPAGPRQVARVVGLANAPRLLAFLVLTPYFGSLFGAVLMVWTLLALVVGARSVFGLGLVEAIAVLGLAWLAIELLSRTLGRPLVALARAVRRVAAGTTIDAAAPLRARRGHEDERER